MDLDQCVCSGKNLPRLLRPAILALLAGGSAHGYSLVQRLGEMELFATSAPDTSGVYKLLKQMEEEGLIAGEWDLGEGGPARRCFTLTKDGRSCIERWAESLSIFRRQLDSLLNLVAADGIANAAAKGGCKCKQESKDGIDR